MGNLMAANETLKKTEVTTVETKPVKDSLSALLTNGDSATKKGNNPCLTKLLHNGNFRSFLTERHSNSKRLF
jgi:SecD/SecF fusion protein